MKNFNVVKIVGFAAMVLGGIAQFVSSWSQNAQLDELVDKKVSEKLAEQNEEES